MVAVGGRLAATAISFFTVRLYIEWCGGKDLYGVYLLTFTVMQYVGLLDLNYSVGAQKYMVESLIDGDIDRADRIMGSQVTLYLATAILGFVVMTLFGAFSEFKGVAHVQSFAAFAFIGVNFAMNLLTQTLTNGALAHNKLIVAVKSGAFRDTTVAITTLIFGYFFRSVGGLALGTAVGSVIGFLFFVFLLKRGAPEVRFAMGWEWPLVKEFSRIGLRNVPNSIIGNLANRGDRLMLGFGATSLSVFTDYSNASKPCDLAYSLLGPVVPLFTPEVTRNLKVSVEAAASTVRKNGLTIWALGCCLVILPSAGGDQFLKIWLKEQTVSNGGTIMVLMSIYFVSELHFNVLASVFMANGTPHRLFKFPLVNALLTLALTLPVYGRFGLVGVAAMNASIALGQLVPRVIICDRELEESLHWPAYLGRCLTILGITGIGWVALNQLTSFASMHGWGRLSLVVCVLAALLAITAMFASKLAPMPGVLADRLGRLRAKR